MLRSLRAFSGAEAATRQAVAIREKLAHDFPNVSGYRCDLAKAYENMVCHFTFVPDRVAEAELYCQKALQLYDELHRKYPCGGPAPQARVCVLNALGKCLANAKRWEEAEKVYRQGLAILHELGSAALGAAEYESWVGVSTQELARVRYGRGDQAEAFQLLDAAVQHLEAALQARPRHSPYLQRLHHCFNDTLLGFWGCLPDRRTIDAELSVRLAKKAMAHEWWGRDCPAFPDILGTASYLAGDYPTAVTVLEKLIAENPNHPASVRPTFFLAMAHACLKNAAEARKWYDQAAQGMAKHKLQDEELRRLRAEASALLGVQENSKLKPGDFPDQR